MNNTLRILIIILGLNLAGLSFSQVAQASGSLVLYDSSGNGKLGQMDGIMLRNLLGHFEGDTIGGSPFNLADVTLMDVKNYKGEITNAKYQSIFYLGSDYDNPTMPAQFLRDVSQTPKTVVWFKYNLWKLAWDPAYSAWSQNIGFSFVQLRGIGGDPAASPPNFFNTVTYKGESFVKYYAYSGGVINADPDVGQTAIINPVKAQALVTIKNAVTSEAIPYVVKSGNFWYVADIPFSYIGPRDRYLVFADLLHDMLGSNHAESHRALIRLEDVGVLVDPVSMQQLTDYMNPRHIPFSIAVIPFYRDPLGIYNGGVKQEIHLDDAGAGAIDLRASLDYALPRGGRVLMHGYTHQFASTVCNYDKPSSPCDYGNQYSQVSGEDFEFWDRPANTPAKGDSATWATGRYSNGLAEMTTRLATKKWPTYPPFAWEVPHYQASPIDYRAFVTWARQNSSRPQKTYQRVMYYTSDTPNFAKGDLAAGQFFPYPVRDYYGQRVLPENLGNIEYDICKTDPTSCGVVYTADDILLNAQKAKVVRDGYASWFFHPFWVEAGVVPGNPGFSDFTRTMEGITTLGYQWVDPGNL